MAALPDLNPYWMPFTDNRGFKANPKLMASAQGVYYTTHDGRQILDGISGLWCCNAGHCHPRIVAAIQSQAQELDYALAFQMGHPKVFELAQRLKQLAPGDLNYSFFTNSGSEAVDTALKVAIAYHRLRGEGQRTRIIGREKGYHGVGFGGISVGGISPNRKMFGPALLPGVDHLPHTHNLEHNSFTRGQPTWGAHLADELENIVALHDASTIAAVIVEPIAGSAGVIIPPKGYLQRLREICDKHGILLIHDEVICGFGRTGQPFASQTFGVTPDILTVAKGLTSGSVPMGAAIVSESIYDTFMNQPGEGIEFAHGYTYSGHPLAAAAALATLDVYQKEGLFEQGKALAPVLEEAVHKLKGLPHVIDIRNFALLAAIELEPIEGQPTARAMKVFQHCFDNGVLIRTTGDTIALCPALLMKEEELLRVVDAVEAGLKATAM